MYFGSSSLFCEWLFHLILPNFFSSIVSGNGQHNVTIFDYLVVNLNNTTIDFKLHNLTLDLLNHYYSCTNAESNFLYFLWILNIFKPILFTIFCVLLILPLLVCLIIYATSIYLLLTKHWRRFKVSPSHF